MPTVRQADDSSILIAGAAAHFVQALPAQQRAGHSRRQAVRAWLLRAQVELFCKRFGTQVIANVCVATASVLIFTREDPSGWTRAWLVAVMLNGLARLLPLWGLRARPGASVRARQRALLLAEGLDGLLWAALILSLPFLPDGSNPPFLFALVAGLGAGPIPFLTVLPGAYPLYVVPPSLAFAWRSAASGDWGGPMPFIILALTGVTLLIGRVNQRNVHDRLLSQYRLDRLLARIRHREATVRALVEASPDLIAVFDIDGRWRLGNPTALQTYEMSPGDAGSGSLGAHLALMQDVRRRDALTRLAAEPGNVPAREELLIGQDSEGWRVLDVLRAPLPLHAGGGWVVVGRDITEQRREALGRQLRDRLAQASLRGDALETALGPVMHSIADHLGLHWIAMLRVDNQGLPMGLAQGGALRFDRETATALVLAAAEPPARVVCPIVYQGEEYGRLAYRPATDGALPADARTWLERVATEVGAACQLDAAQDRLRVMAHYDSLTGLPNRSLFLHHLRQAMASAAEGDCLHALLFLDLDRFKSVNDSLGHAAGDQLLKEVGLRLRQVVRGRDIVARLSGDEYAILLHRTGGMVEIENTLARVLAVLRTPIRLGTDQISTRGSIGLTLLPLDESDAAGLVRHADLAMYEAKRSGRDRWHLFEPRLDSETLERHDLEQRLRQALAEDKFILHFQPQVDLRTGRVVGVEALLRWADPTALPRSPEIFVPVAEETGLIIPLGEWVLREACAQQQRWMQAGLTLQVAVNLSPTQFLDPELHRRVEEALAAGGGAAEYIALEITERAAFADPRRARAILDGWRANGMQCAIDDFGTGQASLSYLTDLPAEVIKIDRAFIAPLPNDPPHCAIVEGVIHMGHQLGRKVLAEGVETAEQLAWLRDQGCDLAQGFTIAEPMPAEAVSGWIKAWDARRPLSRQRVLPHIA